jgi:hypothetical protein
MLRRSILARLGVVAAVLAVVICASATLAFAEPIEQTMGVAALQAKLDAAGGSINGYLKTVDKGSTIMTIPVTVLAVTTGYGSGPVDMTSLIYFKATGPEIDDIGGIAAGMSGSPIYISDSGTDTLIGALSYGDMFTLNGAGLATPIEAMSAMEGTYASSRLPRTLTSPIIVNGQVKKSVMIVSGKDKIASPPANTIVARPLSAMFIGGLNPRSRMYKALAAHFTNAGADVVPLQGGLSAMESSYSAPFKAGSGIAVLASRGDMWMGGVGTVTYANAQNVVAFGHPAYWEGDSGLYMSNAWIDGVWPSSYEAYKLARPAALRGTLVQDRLEGIVGVDGALPPETPITARGYNEATGKVATSTVWMPRYAINYPGYEYMGLAAGGAYVAGSRLYDNWTNPGSADTTTTVVVSDGTTIYTIVRTNHFSDAYDITMPVANDVNDIVSAFEDVNSNGIAHADIQSVNLDATYHAARKEAEIVAVNVPGGLHSGANTAVVSVLLYGDPATHTVNVPFTIPAGDPLAGYLTASAANESVSSMSLTDLISQVFGFSSGSYVSTDRRTVADVVAEERNTLDNTTIELTFQPTDFSSSSSATPTANVSYDAIEATLTTPWVVSSSATKMSPYISASADFDSYNYGNEADISGMLFYVNSGKVTVSGTGIPATTVDVQGSSFEYFTPPLTHSATMVFTFAGDSSTLPARCTLPIRVFAKTTLKSSATSVRKGQSFTMSAEVRPHSAGGSVLLQRWNGSSWTTLHTTPVPPTGKAAWAYKATKMGTVKLRARFTGSSVAAASNSAAVNIKVSP